MKRSRAYETALLFVRGMNAVTAWLIMVLVVLILLRA
jgi:hypothetical protein